MIYLGCGGLLFDFLQTLPFLGQFPAANPDKFHANFNIFSLFLLFMLHMSFYSGE